MEVLTAFGGSNGLPDGPVSALAVAPNGGVWASVEGGVCQFFEGSWSCYPIGADSQEGS